LEIIFFYIDIEGHIEDISIKNALKELGFFAASIKLLGSYPRGK
jgi:prephenate dehydratase